jgi:ribosomal protein S18 acetylase RimI-like enzyme
MIIRPATPHDIRAITRLKDIQDDSRYIKRVSETAEGVASYLLAEENGELVGQIFLKYYGTPTYPGYPNMEDLLVSDRFRQRGIGTALIVDCEKLASEKGFTKIGLSVNPQLNPQAKLLYEQLGYASVGGEPYLSGVYNGTEDWVIDLAKEL